MGASLPIAEIMQHLRQLLQADSEQEIPVVQSVSLFFWQKISQWVELIARAEEPFTVALAGASGSGKSFIREVLVDRLSRLGKTASFTQDNYYRDFEADFPHLSLASFYDEIDFDDPAHIRFDHLNRDLLRLKAHSFGTTLAMPKLIYGTPTSKPTIMPEGMSFEVSPYIVTEGIFAFYDPSILPLYDIKIFVDIDEKERRARWLDRNRRENRGTTDNMWQTTVLCLENFILPSREVADIVLNNNAPQAAVEQFIHSLLFELSQTVARHKQVA